LQPAQNNKDNAMQDLSSLPIKGIKDPWKMAAVFPLTVLWMRMW
jgi:hypothetical protein